MQYDGDVTITADLHAVQEIRGVRVIYYHRESGPTGAFQVDTVAASASDDGQAWRPLAQMRHQNQQQRTDLLLDGCFALTAPAVGKARYVKLDGEKDGRGRPGAVGPDRDPRPGPAARR